MSRLPEFDRALIVVSPSGDAIATGSKTAVVKTRRYFIENETILIIQNHCAIGTIRLMAPQALTLSDFRRARPRHQVSEEERRRSWPRRGAFFLYEIAEFHPLEAPVSVGYPRGAQVFVRAESLTVA
jgi:hypothetical protein